MNFGTIFALIKLRRMLVGMKSFLWVAIIFLLSGCSNTHSEIRSSYDPYKAPSEELAVGKKSIVLATGDVSGVYYPLGTGLMTILEEYNKAAFGTRVTNASIQNAKLVSSNEVELGISMADVLYSDELSQKHLNVLTNLYRNYMQIVTSDPSIESLSDLKGKRVSLGAEGSGTRFTAERLLDAAGLSQETMDISYLSFTQSAAGMNNGTIDVAFLSSGLPNPVIEQLLEEENLTLVKVDEETSKRLNRQYEGYEWQEIPSYTYEGITEPTPTVTVQNVLYANEELSNELAYHILKGIYEHLDEWAVYHPAVANMTVEEAATNIAIPLHPGAKQYINEVGGK